MGMMIFFIFLTHEKDKLILCPSRDGAKGPFMDGH
jgi:hypothetical protein